MAAGCEIMPYHHHMISHHRNTHTHFNQGPMSPYSERHGQNRELGVGGQKDGIVDGVISAALK